MLFAIDLGRWWRIAFFMNARGVDSFSEKRSQPLVQKKLRYDSSLIEMWIILFSVANYLSDLDPGANRAIIVYNESWRKQERYMKKLVHTREISMRTFDLGDHDILVEGRLMDHRYRPGRDKASEEPEPVHHMVVQLKVKGPEMLIEQAEATMPHHPRKECPEVLPWIQNLEGLEIAPGYSMKVKRIIGGVRGCAHLTSLVIAMGESAVQGYWTAYGSESGKKGLREQTIKKFINTCHLWKEDGPIIKEIRETYGSSSK